jgi:hypothetical protein
MAEVKPPVPVKFFVASLYSSAECLQKAIALIEKEWGVIDFQSMDYQFNVTDYYAPEMGNSINRKLIVLKELYSPVFLVDMKLRCNAIELELSVDNNRLVNLDAGFLDHNKIVLASAKDAGQKIYLDKGIYADLAGRYKAGKYQPFEWSFPDFRDGRYDKDLVAIRKTYMKQLKIWRDTFTDAQSFH